MVFTRPVLFRVARIVGVAVLTRLTDVFPIPLSTAHVIAAPDRAASTRQVVNHPITAGQDLASAWLTYRGRSRRTGRDGEEFPWALTILWPWLDAVCSLGLLLLADLVH
jgi:hypothetical protein